MLAYDSKYIETDAFLMACEEDRDRLEGHLRQFDPSDLTKMISACAILEHYCGREIRRKRSDL